MKTLLAIAALVLMLLVWIGSSAGVEPLPMGPSGGAGSARSDSGVGLASSSSDRRAPTEEVPLARAESEEPLDAALRATITGRTVDSEGEPVPFHDVTAELQGIDLQLDRPPFRLKTRSDGEGRFAFHELPVGGEYIVRAQRVVSIATVLWVTQDFAMLQQLERRVVVPEHTVELVVASRTAGFSVRISAPTPRSAGSGVRVQDSGGTTTRVAGWDGRVVELRGRPGFAFDLEVVGPGGTIHREPLVIPEGGVVETKEVTLEASARRPGLKLQVIDPHGRPVERYAARVHLQRIPSPDFVFSVPSNFDMRPHEGGWVDLKEWEPGILWAEVQVPPETGLLPGLLRVELPTTLGVHLETLRLDRAAEMTVSLSAAPRGHPTVVFRRRDSSDQGFRSSILLDPETGRRARRRRAGVRYPVQGVFRPGVWEFRLGDGPVVTQELLPGVDNHVILAPPR